MKKNTWLWVGLAAAAGLGFYLYTRKKGTSGKELPGEEIESAGMPGEGIAPGEQAPTSKIEQGAQSLKRSAEDVKEAAETTKEALEVLRRSPEARALAKAKREERRAKLKAKRAAAKLAKEKKSKKPRKPRKPRGRKKSLGDMYYI